MRQLIRLDLALLIASWPARIAIVIFALSATLSVLSGMEWQQRYETIADRERAFVQSTTEDLSAIYDGIEDGSVTPSNLRLPEDQWPPLAEYIIDPRDPYQAAYNQYQLADLPSGPVMALANGVTPLHPNHVIIHSRALPSLFRPGAAPERTNPSVLALGRFDLLSVIFVMVPLMAIAFLHDARARETESGISSTLRAMGVRHKELLMARIATRGGLLVILVVVSILLGGLFSGAQLNRLSLFTLAASLYSLFWVLLIGALARLVRSAVGSTALGLTLFASLCFVGPGMAESLSRPDGLVQPRAVVNAEITSLRREWGRGDLTTDRIQYVAEAFWGVPEGQIPECANHPAALKSMSANRLSDAAFEKAVLSAHATSSVFDRRLDLVGALLLPLGFHRSMEEIAGSSAARADKFERSVIIYHALWRDRATDALMACQTWDRVAFDSAPKYRWTEPAPNSRTLTLALTGLGLWAALGTSIILMSKRESQI